MSIQKHFLILFVTLVFSNNISFTPEFIYKYNSDNEQYAISNLSTQNFELALIAKYNEGSINILARIGYNLINGTRERPSDFTRTQGLHWVEYPAGLNKDQGNYYITDMKMQYGNEKLFLYLNKWNKHWGPGVNSLTLSSKMPTFFHFGFKWKLADNINFDYFHGRLNSRIPDSNYTNYYNVTNRNYDIVRNIVGHKLEWQPYKNLIFSASEIVIYANRSLEAIYIAPFLPFFSLQQNVGEIDNIILSGDVQYFLKNNVRFYGALLIDEWSPPYTFERDNRNWFGWQVGLDFEDMLVYDSNFHLEYTWTDHRIYRHRYSVNDYYSHGFPIGFWGGPHAEEIYADYSFNINKNYLKFIYSHANRGMLSDAMLEDQYSRPNDQQQVYERFSGGKETKQMLLFSISRNITSSVNLQFSYTYSNWKKWWW